MAKASSANLPSAPVSQPVQMAIVEDDAGFRQVLQRIFAGVRDFNVVAACPNGEAALRALPGSGCELVIMDINLPGMSGIECLQELKTRIPGVRVVMLTSFDDNENLFQSLVAGADGYLLKRVARDRLLEAVRDIAAGGAPISPQIARRMVEYFHHLKTDASGVAAESGAMDPTIRNLTSREHEVLALLAKGFTPKEVAGELGISWQTVRNFIKSIYDKLHVHNRTDAILKYLGRTPGAPT